MAQAMGSGLRLGFRFARDLRLTSAPSFPYNDTLCVMRIVLEVEEK
jgi:hypothetical protein